MTVAFATSIQGTAAPCAHGEARRAWWDQRRLQGSPGPPACREQPPLPTSTHLWMALTKDLSLEGLQMLTLSALPDAAPAAASATEQAAPGHNHDRARNAGALSSVRPMAASVAASLSSAGR